MIQARLDQGKDGFTGARIAGHSGMSEAGSDIVCAAVSILGCTCVNALESCCGIVPEILENRDGALAFRLPEMTAEENGKAQILMGALKQGLSDLEEAYPKNLRVTIREIRTKGFSH